MTWVIAILARLGAPQRLLRPLAWLLVAVALLASLAALKGCYDRSVEKRYEAKVAAEVTKRTQAATETANRNDAARKAENARADEQLRGAIRDAEANHPEEVRRPAGPAVSGALDRLRERETKAGPPAR